MVSAEDRTRFLRGVQMSGEPLRPGEPVTLVLPDHIVQVEVFESRRDGFMCKLSSRNDKTIDSPWTLDQEGVGWLRGYHAADSPEVLACRTAQALAEKTEKKPSGVHHGPTGMAGVHGLPPIGGTSYIGNVSGGASVGLDEDYVKNIFDKFMKDCGL